MLAVFCWGSYAAPLANAVGFWNIVSLIMLTSLIIGPSLTFLVYKSKKKSLKFDLICIFILQIITLLYGAYTLYIARPVWIVHSVDRFELVRNTDLYDQDSIPKNKKFEFTPKFSVKFVGVELSKNPVQRQEDLSRAMFAKLTLSMQPSRYILYQNVQKIALKNAHNLKELFDYNAHIDVTDILEKNPESFAYIPLKASHKDMSVLIDKNGNVIRIVNLRPWN